MTKVNVYIFFNKEKNLHQFSFFKNHKTELVWHDAKLMLEDTKKIIIDILPESLYKIKYTTYDHS